MIIVDEKGTKEERGSPFCWHFSLMNPNSLPQSHPVIPEPFLISKTLDNKPYCDRLNANAHF
jgi:hypothetical protein